MCSKKIEERINIYCGAITGCVWAQALASYFGNNSLITLDLYWLISFTISFSLLQFLLHKYPNFGTISEKKSPENIAPEQNEISSEST